MGPLRFVRSTDLSKVIDIAVNFPFFFYYHPDGKEYITFLIFHL